MTTLNFEPWNELLQQYVDDKGRVNYSLWKANDQSTLTNWLIEINKIDSQTLTNPDEQLAFWINIYNASTILTILNQYPIRSIQPKVFGIPNWIAFLRFFTRSVPPNYRYSLNHIEHKILRRNFIEPRIHFALVCASIGCPLLRNEAYFPERVQTQLEDDTIRFINNFDKVHYEYSTNILYCSKIFKWYKTDFLKVSESIQTYIGFYLKVDEVNSDTPIKYLEYNWRLNQK